MPVIEGRDDILEADDPHETPIVQNGRARDTALAQQSLHLPQAVVGDDGHHIARHGIAHFERVNELVGNGKAICVVDNAHRSFASAARRTHDSKRGSEVV